MIKSKTIWNFFNAPQESSAASLHSYSAIENQLLQEERRLRKKAYSNSKMELNSSFYDDSDMDEDFAIVCVYDKTNSTALLSARYYFDKKKISSLIGKQNSQFFPELQKQEQAIFLIDRMAGNVHHPIYRRKRNYLMFKFYKELMLHNRNIKFIAMARSDDQEKLLSHYIRIGLKLKGHTMHNGVKHWVLKGDFDEIFKHLRLSNKLLIGLSLRKILPL